MPYRRLPNTDAARIRALETALNNEEFSNINNLPFSLHLRQKIEFFLPKFKTAITNSQCARDKQNVNIGNMQNILEKQNYTFLISCKY